MKLSFWRYVTIFNWVIISPFFLAGSATPAGVIVIPVLRSVLIQSKHAVIPGTENPLSRCNAIVLITTGNLLLNGACLNV